MKLLFTFWAIMLSLPFWGIGQTTVSLSPSQDNTLYEDAEGDVSNGAGEFLFTGKTGQASNALRRAVIRFELSDSIPVGAAITQVQLQLQMTKTIVGASPVSLHRLSRSWGEGTSDANGEEGGGTVATPGDASWVFAFSDTASWATAGGDFAATTSATTSVDAAGSYTWTDSLMVVDVQAWLDDPDSNFGWILLGDEVNNSAKQYGSKENAEAGNRPVLTITYTEGDAIGRLEIPTVRVYPNPATDQLRVEIPASGPAEIAVYDAMGRLLWQETSVERLHGLSLTALPAGYYSVRVAQKGQLYRSRFVKE